MTNLANFTMLGGSITGNTSRLVGAGILSLKDITLGGDINISDNKVGNTNSNIDLVYLINDMGSRTAPIIPTIKISEALTNTNQIGVSILEMKADISVESQTGVFTSGDAVTNSDYAENFTADNSNFAVAVADNNQLKLEIASPTITAGANQSIIASTTSDLVVTSSADLANFQGVEVGKQGTAPTTLTEDAHYTKASGSTIVTLKNSYLKTLSAGTYTLNIVSTTGTATTTFTIKASGGSSSGGAYSYDYYDIKITKEGNGNISPDGG
ncbi:hypothetical protein [Anaerotignum sp.]|uniref:hypothetical protein n=1 Tax=Anaerotignum sp. TaxID=2039241 RepID=UPI00331BDF7E